MIISRCGPGVTIQDAGRFGYDRLGVTTGGAVDHLAWMTGRDLVGNVALAAGLEIPLGDLQFSVDSSRRIAVTGAPVGISVGQQTMAMNTSFLLPANTPLTLTRPSRGVYTYVSVAGGITTEPVLGSRSTVVRERLGGMSGRALCVGDRLPLGDTEDGNTLAIDQSATGRCCSATGTTKLRFLPGFQFQSMRREAQQTLLGNVFEVTGRANRMGVRLHGEDIDTGMNELWSEGTCLGAIQIPPDGQPIVLLNDRQTMGGYPKAGAVIASDCARLAQLRPGARVQFSLITEREADRIRWLEDNYLRERRFSPAPQMFASIRHTQAGR